MTPTSEEIIVNFVFILFVALLVATIWYASEHRNDDK